MSDEIFFAEDDEVEVQFHGTWKVLIVDDEPEIHAVTKLALGDFVFQDKRIEFISVFSGAEAKKAFMEHDDISVVLLDVVMETDDAGLIVANFIRNEIDNHFTRIILRTGQPGQAPERDVIVNYDINDYKSKTELTAQKLFSVVIAALRSYHDINVIEENRKGLEKVIAASADIFTLQSFESFIEGIVQQLSSLLGGTKDVAYLTSAVMGPKPINQYHSTELFVFTGKGEYKNKEGLRLEQVISGPQLSSCMLAYANKSLIYEDEYMVAYCDSKSKRGSLLYLSGLPSKLSQNDKKLIELFSRNVQIAFDNILFNKELQETQQEVIERLGQALEQCSEHGRHILRIVKISQILAREIGLSKEESETLGLAVPLHDIGKIKIPENILAKSEKLTPEEIEVIRQHADFGYDLLKDSTRPLIKAAALIARDHHEYWDGNGYPRGKSGESIHIYCRITSLADAYDVMRHKNSYQDALSAEESLRLVIEQKGKQFDPTLVRILEENINKIEEVITLYPDF
ncbi:DUF3369 domain-containing protein [Paraglaciecola marina]|uniref:DUF3369 domain-containing protein n=1 Tax=Paraglaciecola marina TaxID=2500157 RepID=UPI001060837E|nr:DUF3369 domain-containing protein [Paraglaciecola marina]